MRGPGPGALGTIGANRRTHQSCRGRRCAPGDTHRLPSPGGTSLQDHTGRTGSSWHRTSPESSLRDRQGGGGVEGPRSALGLGAGREFPFSGYLLSRGIQSSLGDRNSSHPGGGRPPPGGTGRAGRSWLPSVLEGTLQETRWLSGGAGHPRLDELSAPSSLKSSQPWSPGDTKFLNRSRTPMSHTCLSRAQLPTGTCTWLSSSHFRLAGPGPDNQRLSNYPALLSSGFFFTSLS